MDLTAASIAETAKQHLQECSRVLVWNGQGSLLYADCKVLPGELQQLAACFGDREAAIQTGLRLEGRRYEVYRHHPPLVYGRSAADCEPEQSTGIAVCHVDAGKAGSGRACYIAATFEQPHTSAFIVPKLLHFAQRHL